MNASIERLVLLMADVAMEWKDIHSPSHPRVIGLIDKLPHIEGLLYCIGYLVLVRLSCLSPQGGCHRRCCREFPLRLQQWQLKPIRIRIRAVRHRGCSNLYKPGRPFLNHNNHIVQITVTYIWHMSNNWNPDNGDYFTG